MERKEEFISGYDKAIALNIDVPDYHSNKGGVLPDQGRNEEASAEESQKFKQITLNLIVISNL